MLLSVFHSEFPLCIQYGQKLGCNLGAPMLNLLKNEYIYKNMITYRINTNKRLGKVSINNIKIRKPYNLFPHIELTASWDHTGAASVPNPTSKQSPFSSESCSRHRQMAMKRRVVRFSICCKLHRTRRAYKDILEWLYVR